MNANALTTVVFIALALIIIIILITNIRIVQQAKAFVIEASGCLFVHVGRGPAL